MTGNGGTAVTAWHGHDDDERTMMARVTNEHGRPVEVAIPLSVEREAPVLVEAVGTISRVEGQLAAERETRATLAGELERAELERVSAIADAAIEDRKLPTTDSTKALREKIATADARIAGLEAAVERAKLHAVEVLDRDRAQLVEEARVRLAEAAAAAAVALDEYLEQRLAMCHAHEDVRWIEAFPRTKSNWSDSHESVIHRGSPLSWGEVESMLRQDVDLERRLKAEPLNRMPVPDGRDELGRPIYRRPGQAVPQ